MSDPPINDLTTFEELRISGSCDWLTTKQEFTSWRTAWSDSQPNFWLTGNAGTGKSVLCSRVIHDLQAQNLRTSYFFFKGGSTMDSSISTFLRAIAFQMAKSDEAVMQKLLEVEQDTVPCTAWDDKTVWQKLFVDRIFKIAKPLPQYWVVDALDECQKLHVFLNLVTKIPSYIRIFFTSRLTSEAEKGLRSLDGSVQWHHLRDSDTLQDLGNLIDSRMDHIPVGDEIGHFRLKDKLLSKSSGSFLWTNLVLRELEQVYSEESAEEVLNEVPEDMNELYVRMLRSLPTNERSMKLTRSIMTWTLFSLRALTVDEMQGALKVDTNQTIQNLGRSITAICGQFIAIDQSNRIRNIHQTAQEFLLTQTVLPAFVMDRSRGHNAVAQNCLKILTQAYSQNMTAVNTPGTFDHRMMDYAATFFSDHLQKSLCEDSETWSLLTRFLETNILTWIEYLAFKGNIYHIVRTAKNLRGYLLRRIKKIDPINAGREMLECWVNDLIKLSAKFRMGLKVSPSSIHTLIPSLCPQDSKISRLIATRRSSFAIKGLQSRTWDDCLARFDFPAAQTNSVALGDKYLAVAVSDGNIYLYYRDSFLTKSVLCHGEKVRILAHDTTGSMLASSSMKKISLWDLDNDHKLYTFHIEHSVLSLRFAHEGAMLVAATQGNYAVSWDLRLGLEKDRWFWNDKSRAHEGGLNRPPGRAFISPDSTLLAVCHRGLPVSLFDLEQRTFFGVLRRDPNAKNERATSQYWIDALAINLCGEINVAVVSYGDGELTVFDLQSTKLQNRYPDIFAQSLTCSPDGRTLVTGSSRGTIQIFEFAGSHGDKLSLLHRIDSQEDGIRSLAFSTDNLSFADIRENQCRLWDPSVLIRDDAEHSSRSEANSEVTLVPRSMSMLGDYRGTEISVVIYDQAGDFVFCGKQDGSVSYFNAQSAAFGGVLYQHATNARVTAIAYSVQSCSLISADESGRVLIKKIKVAHESCMIENSSAEIRLEEPVKTLLLNSCGNSLLIQGSHNATIWMMDGNARGSPILLSNENIAEKTIVNDPRGNENFLIIADERMHIYSWLSGLEVEPFTAETIGALRIELTPSPPEEIKITQFEALMQNQQQHPLPPPSPLPPTPSNRSPFVARLIRDTSTPLAKSFGAMAPTAAHTSKLQVWPASAMTSFGSFLQPEALPDPDNIGRRVSQIIAMDGERLIFLDTDHWVCSLLLLLVRSSPLLLLDASKVQRHFFLLSEWQSGAKGFLIQYCPTNREFAIASKDRVGIVKGGLDLAEPWIRE